MCTLGEPAAPSSTAQALAMVRAGLGYLSACDAAEPSTPVLAEALIGMIERSRTSPDRDSDRFDDRAVWLETTIGGAGHLTGDLTGPAAAAAAAVLEALSAKGGAEDTRTLPQRQHDALAEACTRTRTPLPRATRTGRLTGGEGLGPCVRNRRSARPGPFGFMPAAGRHNWPFCETLAGRYC